MDDDPMKAAAVRVRRTMRRVVRKLTGADYTDGGAQPQTRSGKTDSPIETTPAAAPPKPSK